MAGCYKNEMLLMIVFVVSSLLFGIAFSEDTELGHRCGLIPFISSNYNISRALVVAGLINNTASHHGFWNATFSESDAPCYGLALCRGDLSMSMSPDDCTACVHNAALALINDRCPNAPSGILCRNDCFVKYSDQDFFGKVDNDNIVSLTSGGDFELSSSTDTMKKMLSELIERATEKANRYYFADGDAALPLNDHTHIDPASEHGMVQCTRDLSRDDCKVCLDDTLKMIPALKKGELFVKGSCNIRYDPNDFDN